MTNAPRYLGLVLLGLMTTVGASQVSDPPATRPSHDWTSLFNGKDLQGWTPKFAGHPYGENVRDTFRAEDGVLKVAYDNYESFDGLFGHLFYETEFDHYILRFEYRFVGEQVPGAPGWAFRNNGMMIHGQPGQSMRVDQNFPVSLEVQLLGGDGTHPRPTGNVCTPGTHVVLAGSLDKRHCISSDSQTHHGDDWIRCEIEVHGDRRILHRINGEVVLEYASPQLDDADDDAKMIIAARVGKIALGHGTISIQAESHPTEFRKIEIRKISRD